MALRQRNRIRQGEGVATLTLEALANESFLVKDIAVINGSSDPAFVTILIRDKQVGYFRVVGQGGNHLGFLRAGMFNRSLLWDLFLQGVFEGYPIASGETLTITLDAGTANILVLYDEHDAGDFTPTAPNGSRSSRLLFLNYGTNLAALIAAGFSTLNNSRNPAGFEDFPFGATVPAQTSIELLGVIGQAVGRRAAAGVDNARTNHLRFIRGGDFLFDRDRLGRRFLGVIPGADGVDYTSADQFLTAHDEARAGAIALFPEPLVLAAGTELLVQTEMEITAGAGTLVAGDVDLAALLRVIRGGPGA